MRTIGVIIVGMLVVVLFVAKCSSIDTEDGAHAESETQEKVDGRDSDEESGDTEEKPISRRQSTRPVLIREQSQIFQRQPKKPAYPVLKSYEPLRDNGKTIQNPEPAVEDLFKPEQ